MVTERVRRALPVGGVLLTVALGTWWAGRPVTPLPSDAAPERFSEARALEVLTALTAQGPRPAFSPAAHRAAELLRERLARLPGVRVEFLDAEGELTPAEHPGPVTVYRVRDVVARLEGAEPGAVLLSAHYDSVAEGAGASDNGLGVAAALEVFRALSLEASRRSPVVLVLSGAEEPGLVGSDAVLAHPWTRDVTSFLNLDAAGSAGRAVLFRATGGGGARLVRAYARAVPSPTASVVGQDVLGSGLVPFFTDFERYGGAGWSGVDLAPIRGGYTYHTALDRPERLAPGTLQHLGDSTLALVRALVHGAPAPAGDEGPVTFFDVAGLGMVVYGRSTAVALVVFAWGLLAVAFVGSLRRGLLRASDWGGGLLGVGLGTLSGLLLPVALALGVGVGLGRPHGWYAWPVLGVVTYGLAALGGVWLGDGAWAWLHRRRGGTPAQRASRRWAGAALGSGFILALATGLGLGLSYLPAVGCVGTVLGLLLVLRRPDWAGRGLVGALLPGALLSAQVGALLISLFIPMTGHLYAGVPLDAVLALLVALPVGAGASVGLLGLPWESWRWRGAGAVLAVALIGAVALALLPASTVERPRRVRVVQRDTPEGPSVTIDSLDGLALGDAVPGLSEDERMRSRVQSPLQPGDGTPEAPRIEVLRRDEHGGTREVSVRIFAPAGAEVRLEAQSLSGWSLGTLPPGASRAEASAFDVPASGWVVTFRMSGSEPIALRVSVWREGAVLPGLVRLREGLPATSTGSFAAVGTRVQLL